MVLEDSFGMMYRCRDGERNIVRQEMNFLFPDRGAAGVDRNLAYDFGFTTEEVRDDFAIENRIEAGAPILQSTGERCLQHSALIGECSPELFFKADSSSVGRCQLCGDKLMLHAFSPKVQQRGMVKFAEKQIVQDLCPVRRSQGFNRLGFENDTGIDQKVYKIVLREIIE